MAIYTCIFARLKLQKPFEFYSDLSGILPLTAVNQVCRVRATVNITGVGSVRLSWFTGDRR